MYSQRSPYIEQQRHGALEWIQGEVRAISTGDGHSTLEHQQQTGRMAQSQFYALSLDQL